MKTINIILIMLLMIPIAFAVDPVYLSYDPSLGTCGTCTGGGDVYVIQGLNFTDATELISNASNGQTAYTWGDHASVGYLTVESDPQVDSVTVNKWCIGTGTQVTCNQTAPSGSVPASLLTNVTALQGENLTIWTELGIHNSSIEILQGYTSYNDSNVVNQLQTDVLNLNASVEAKIYYNDSVIVDALQSENLSLWSELGIHNSSIEILQGYTSYNDSNVVNQLQTDVLNLNASVEAKIYYNDSDIVNGIQSDYWNYSNTLSANITPSANNTYNIGKSTSIWDNGYFGDLYIANTIYHLGDTDTYIDFSINQTAFKTGGLNFLRFMESDALHPYISFNVDSDDINAYYKTASSKNLQFWDANNEMIGIMTSSPNYTLDVLGTINAQKLKLNGTGIISYNDSTVMNSLQTEVSGKKRYHGIQDAGALNFSNTTHIVSLASVKYWYNGTSYESSTPINCDLDSYVTLTKGDLYYIYFSGTNGTLQASESFWNLYQKVPVATVFWNGTKGALVDELHRYDRDIAWHTWAHLSIGTRYISGFDLTKPTTVLDDNIDITGGVLYDEDLREDASQSTSARLVYQSSSGIYSFFDTTYPYGLDVDTPVYLDTDTYTLTPTGAAKYSVFWVYATDDSFRHIYIIPQSSQDPYNTIGEARQSTAPNLQNLAVNPEMKLLYRFIYKGDGEFQESADYRLSSAIVGSGSTSTVASSVGFAPSGTISATNVQTAIEELDSEVYSNISTEISQIVQYNDSTVVNTLQTDLTNLNLSVEAKIYYNDSTIVNNLQSSMSEASINISYLQGENTTIWDELNENAANYSYMNGSVELRAPIASPTFTGYITAPKLTNTELNSSNITVTSLTRGLVSDTEFSYLDGVTSAIQTQFNENAANYSYTNGSVELRAPIASPTFTGFVTIPSSSATEINSTNITLSGKIQTSSYYNSTLSHGSGATFITMMDWGNVSIGVNGTHICIIGKGKLCVES